MNDFAFHDAEFIPSKTPFLIMGDFLKLFSMSIIIGLIFGFMASYITKRMRFIAQSAIGESFILICFGLFSYELSELMEYSGIVSLLTTALILAHYAWHNLSPQGKHVTSVTFQTLGFGAEAVVFVFVGITLTFYLNIERCWKFVIAEFFIIIIGRTFAILISYYMFACCTKHENDKLSLRELLFISYAALIRGAIAFGLVTNLSDKFEHKEVVESSTLLLVIITTVFFGTFCSLMQKCLLPEKKEEIFKNITE